jgi:putative Holliday junction resolvase
VKARTRILAVDPGKVRLGLAVSDAERRLASPLTTYARCTPEQDAAFFREIIEDEEIGAIVVGLPVHLDGREGEQAKAARSFGAWLKQATGMSCVFFDERFTTSQAESALWDAGLTHKKRKARRDRVAAQILLQTFLDAGCPIDAKAGPLEE